MEKVNQLEILLKHEIFKTTQKQQKIYMFFVILQIAPVYYLP